jgi:AraC-like DNA-binding protein
MQVSGATIERLRELVGALAPLEGRNESPLSGLRYYRFSRATTYRKTQVLAPGIVVVLQGAKSVHLPAGALRYAAGDCLVLGASSVCHGTVVEARPGQPYLAIHLDLPPAMLVKTLLALPEPPAGNPAAGPRQYVAALDPGMADAMLRLLDASIEALDRATLAPLTVEEIVVRLLRSNAAAALRQAAALTRAGARIHKVIAFIHAEFQRPLTVRELAEQAAMSPSHFAHCFREVAGVTPMRYLRDTRLEAARAMMAGAGMRPSDAGMQVGFDSSAHFNRVFRQRYECTPGEFAQRMKTPQ